MHDEARVTGNNCDIGADEFIDSDSDMLPDWWELSTFGDLSKSNVDSDNDSFGNFSEMLLDSDPEERGTVTLDVSMESWHKQLRQRGNHNNRSHRK